MPRTARVVVPGVTYHVTQRGNNRQDVFFVDQDRLAYLALLKGRSNEEELHVLAYCLMRNHVHLVVLPTNPDGLSRALGRSHFSYTLRINSKQNRSGHLWQNRFYSCPLDAEYLWQALRYVETNPVRAGLVSRAWDYPWSSASAHTGGHDGAGVLDLALWTTEMDPATWKDLLAAPQDSETVENLRSSTRTGRPLGSDSFVSKLEVLVGRRLRPLPVGRPRLRN